MWAKVRNFLFWSAILIIICFRYNPFINGWCVHFTRIKNSLYATTWGAFHARKYTKPLYQRKICKYRQQQQKLIYFFFFVHTKSVTTKQYIPIRRITLHRLIVVHIAERLPRQWLMPGQDDFEWVLFLVMILLTDSLTVRPNHISDNERHCAWNRHIYVNQQHRMLAFGVFFVFGQSKNSRPTFTDTELSILNFVR